MSVLIKTMEMPNNCGECQLCHTENFKQWCCLTSREDILYDAIPEWCPLEKRKKGHWIPWKFHNGFKCEICDEPVYDKHNFCPNCGADMRASKKTEYEKAR